MTNKDKFLRDGVSVEEFKTDFCRYLSINGYDISTVGKVCSALEYFLERPITPTLTEDERVILRNMEDATHIKRDNGIKYIDKDEYIKTYYELPYSHLFQFIKERRRI